MLCTSTSARVTSSMSHATSFGSLRSSVIPRLSEFMARYAGETPFQNGGPQPRASSPSGRSTLITSAPMRARMPAAKGPANAPPSSITRIPPSGSAISGLRSGREAKPACLLHDETGAGEVRGADQHAGVCHLLHEGLAGARGMRGIRAEAARPLGLRHLYHAVHEIAGEEGLARLGRQPHAGMARGVAMRGLEAQGVVALAVL